MKVSVIIPVYNAEKYLRNSVRSALAQAETAEVILIDDASADGSLALANTLANEDSRVVVTTHAGGINKGSAETRNAGIRIARFEYIAFIDADDVMLPDRFKLTAKLFEEHADADGVYEAVQNVYTDNAASRSKTVSLEGVPDMHMVHRKVEPDKLLQLLIDDPIGIILLQGLCVKRTLFDKTGLFDPAFRVGEDMLLVKKMAAVGRLYPGSLTRAVSQRLIHDTNISFSEYKDHNPLAYLEGEILLRWAVNKSLPSEKMDVILHYSYQMFMYIKNADFTNGKARAQWIWSVIRISPSLIRRRALWKAAPIIGRIIT